MTGFCRIKCHANVFTIFYLTGVSISRYYLAVAIVYILLSVVIDINSGGKRGPDKALVFQPPRRATAVRSPGSATHYLRKSPSPTAAAPPAPASPQQSQQSQPPQPPQNPVSYGTRPFLVGVLDDNFNITTFKRLVITAFL